MRFTLLMHYSEAGGAALSPEELADGQAAFDAYAIAMDDADVLVAAEVFTSVVESVTIRGGELVDSPDDSEEQLSGIFLIDVLDRAEAIEWAKKSPAAEWGTMVVRPTQLYFDDGSWRG